MHIHLHAAAGAHGGCRDAALKVLPVWRRSCLNSFVFEHVVPGSRCSFFDCTERSVLIAALTGDSACK
jgi:hypothetical protein